MRESLKNVMEDLRKKDFIRERVIGFKDRECKVESILLITVGNPRKEENLNKEEIYKIYFPDRRWKNNLKSKVSNVFTENKGSILLRYKNLIDIEFSKEVSNIRDVLDGIDISKVKKVNNKENIIDEMFRKVDNREILINYISDSLYSGELPEYVDYFINNYIIENNKSFYNRDIKNKVKEWFRNSQYSGDLPNKVYKNQDIWYTKYPIFTTYKKYIKSDRVIEIDIDKEDIIIDLSQINSPNRKDREILIEGEKYYKYRGVNIG